MNGFLRAFLFCAGLSLFHIAYAENHLVYFGGGSSTKKTDNMFDKSLQDVLAYAKSKNLKADFFYRKSLPENLTKEDSAGIKELNPQTFKEKIRELARSISSGKIKPGEQLLIYLDTHGDNVNGTYALTTETDLANGEDLQYLIRAAEKKGVKLGIIGATCYSGSLMKYRTPNTCIITASKPDRIGFYGDVGDLSGAGKNDLTNLESWYLSLRPQYAGVLSQPMISTEAGIQTDELLSPLKSTIIDDSERSQALSKPICTNSISSLSNLEKEIKSLQSTAQVDRQWASQSVGRLRYSIEKYNSAQVKVQAYILAKNKTSCVVAPFMEGAIVNTSEHICANQQQIEWIAANFHKPGENRQSRKGHLTGSKQLADPARSYFIDQTNTEDYKNFQRLKKENQEAIAELNSYSSEIATLERDIYEKAYKKASAESAAPNPCRDFKL
jgi:hypothetical protein